MICLAYNDYEILYLIQEGNEEALRFLYKKYDLLIQKEVTRLYPYGTKRQDLMQEGRMILYNCIRQYNSKIGCNFYNYFLVSLKRALYKQIDNPYYKEFPILEEQREGIENVRLLIEVEYLLDDFELHIYRECILGNMSLRHFSQKEGIPYNALYYKYTLMLQKLKTLLFHK